MMIIIISRTVLFQALLRCWSLGQHRSPSQLKEEKSLSSRNVANHFPFVICLGENKKRKKGTNEGEEEEENNLLDTQ
jgi:hypothetical protein